MRFKFELSGEGRPHTAGECVLVVEHRCQLAEQEERLRKILGDEHRRKMHEEHESFNRIMHDRENDLNKEFEQLREQIIASLDKRYNDLKAEHDVLQDTLEATRLSMAGDTEAEPQQKVES